MLRQGKSLGWTLRFDLALLAIGAYGIYVSTDWLWAGFQIFTTGFISAKYLGWISGWVMVLPNGILAFYYGWRGQPENRLCPRKSAMRMFPSHCVSAFTPCSTRWSCRRSFKWG